MPLYNQKMLLTLTLSLIGMTFIVNAAHSGTKKCATRTTVLEHLNAQYGETRQTIGATPNGQVIETYAHIKTGTWTIILTLANGTSCIMASGTAFQNIDAPKGQGV
jgi:hypothetical protein